MATHYIHEQDRDAHPAHAHRHYAAERSRPLYRATQVVWYVVYVIEAVLLARFALRLFSANPAAPFVELVYSLGAFFLTPFRYIFPSTAVVGSGSVVEWSTLFAALAYWLIALGIVKLILMSRPVSSLEASEKLDHKERL